MRSGLSDLMRGRLWYQVMIAMVLGVAFGIASLSLAPVFQVDIGLSGIILVVVMATGASIGSPGTPGVGIVILATILESVGIPVAGIALIMGVDRILDMCRTSVNVTGDMAASITLNRLIPEAPSAVVSAEAGKP